MPEHDHQNEDPALNEETVFVAGRAHQEGYALQFFGTQTLELSRQVFAWQEDKSTMPLHRWVAYIMNQALDDLMRRGVDFVLSYDCLNVECAVSRHTVSKHAVEAKEGEYLQAVPVEDESEDDIIEGEIIELDPTDPSISILDIIEDEEDLDEVEDEVLGIDEATEYR